MEKSTVDIILDLFPVLLSAASVFFTALILYRENKKKLISEAKKNESEAANLDIDTVGKIKQISLDLVETFKEEMGTLKDELKQCKTKMEEYDVELTKYKEENESLVDKVKKMESQLEWLNDVWEGANKLYKQVESLDKIPVYIPPQKIQGA